MKKLCLEHENLALVHHFMGTICAKVASIFHWPESQPAKFEKLSVCKEVNHIFREFYQVNVISIELVIGESKWIEGACEGGAIVRVALAIDNPTDLTKETLKEKKYHNISSKARVATWKISYGLWFRSIKFSIHYD